MGNKAELIQAAFLFQLGIEVENARKKLKDLVESEVSYESEEMLFALYSFQQLECPWNKAEQEYLALRERIGNNTE